MPCTNIGSHVTHQTSVVRGNMLTEYNISVPDALINSAVNNFVTSN